MATCTERPLALIVSVSKRVGNAGRSQTPSAQRRRRLARSHEADLRKADEDRAARRCPLPHCRSALLMPTANKR